VPKHLPLPKVPSKEKEPEVADAWLITTDQDYTEALRKAVEVDKRPLNPVSYYCSVLRRPNTHCKKKAPWLQRSGGGAD